MSERANLDKDDDIAIGGDDIHLATGCREVSRKDGVATLLEKLCCRILGGAAKYITSRCSLSNTHSSAFALVERFSLTRVALPTRSLR